MTARWWRLAARNLLRHRRRTALTGLIVVTGFVATTMTAGFIAQSFRGLEEVSIRSAGGHLRLLDQRAAGLGDDEAASVLLSDWPAVAEVVRADPRVEVAMPRLQLAGLLAHGERSAVYVGFGAVPELEERAAMTREAVVAGEFLGETESDEVLLGSALARAAGVGVGDLVTVMATTPDGMLNAVDATVVGLLRYPVRELDERILVLPFGAASRLLQCEGRAHAVMVTLRDGVDLDRAARDLGAALAAAGHPVEVRTWLESAVFYRQVRYLYTILFSFMGLVLALVVVLAAANTMMMSVMERTREIGALLAIGMERSRVRSLFLAEGLLLGLAGSLAGAVASLLLRVLLNAARVTLPPPPGGTQGFVLHVDLIPAAYVAGLVLMTATLVLASWWPARRAARLDPVEALQHV